MLEVSTVRDEVKPGLKVTGESRLRFAESWYGPGQLDPGSAGSVQVNGIDAVAAVTPEHAPPEEKLDATYPLSTLISGSVTALWDGLPMENTHEGEPVRESVAATLWVVTEVFGATIEPSMSCPDACRFSEVCAWADPLATKSPRTKTNAMRSEGRSTRLVHTRPPGNVTAFRVP